MVCRIHTDELFRNNKDEVLRRCIPFPEPVRIVRANSGSDFCVFVDAEGAVYSIGTGIRGELGVGNVRVVDEPVRVEALEGVKVVDVKCGKWHTLALTDTGDVYVWGYNEESQIGDNLAGIEWFPCPVDVSLRLQPGDEEDRTVRIEAAAESSTIHKVASYGKSNSG